MRELSPDGRTPTSSTTTPSYVTLACRHSSPRESSMMDCQSSALIVSDTWWTTESSYNGIAGAGRWLRLPPLDPLDPLPPVDPWPPPAPLPPPPQPPLAATNANAAAHPPPPPNRPPFTLQRPPASGFEYSKWDAAGGPAIRRTRGRDVVSFR